ncbi:tRNA threonylcarbamoyladenosine dehydratase [Spirochaetia bacterium]|nr:tRNA threonylcarbamoyladenosine dehydratase [Spirochaetia bacterium]
MAVNPLFQRLSIITGPEMLDRLRQTHVMIFGLGGVGSWCAEALVRSGVGKISIVDSDTICITNVNRQVQATSRTLGAFKADTLKERLLEINPQCQVASFCKVFSKENAELFDFDNVDFVIDAIDSLSHKLDLIELCSRLKLTFFSSMGMAQKLDPTRIKTADIWETSGCPLARLVRQGLRKRGFQGHFTAVYSDESLPLRVSAADIPCGSAQCLCPARNRADPDAAVEWCSSKKIINGSAVTVTAAAGMILASLALRSMYEAPGESALE